MKRAEGAYDAAAEEVLLLIVEPRGRPIADADRARTSLSSVLEPSTWIELLRR